MSTALMRCDFGGRSRPVPMSSASGAWPRLVAERRDDIAPGGATRAFSAGLSSATFRRLAPRAVIGLARQAGLAGIDWDGDTHAPAGVMAPDPEASLGVIGMTTRATGLDCVCYGAAIAPPSDDLGRFAEALAAAERLGARTIRICAGARPSDDYAAAERRQVVAAIRAMADLAESRGLGVSLECHPGASADGTDAARDLLEAIAHPAVDLCWRPRPGLPLAEALHEIMLLGRFVGNVHVSACDDRSRRLPLASRANWWREAFAALAATRRRPDRWAFLAGVRDDDTRAFAEDAACLNELLAKLD